MAAALTTLPVGSVFQGRYEVVRCIAKGGMGAVYEVVHVDTQRHRALKVMLPSADQSDALRERFHRETTVAAEVESEHIAETIDAGVDEDTGAPFIVMELLKGEELGQLLQRRGALPAELAVTLLWQASLALDKTHAAGIVHRDLKPENLFVTLRDDGTPCIKLLDFGIAKLLQKDAGSSTTRGIIGTPLYISPEQVHGEVPVSGRSDSYALAQIAYTLLTGEAYWRAEEQATEGPYPLLMAVAKGLPERATTRAKARRDVTLPPAFDAWFARATARDPNDRFPSCAALVDGLAEALGTPQPCTSSMESQPPLSVRAQPSAHDPRSGAAPRPDAQPDDAPTPSGGGAGAEPSARTSGSTEQVVTRTIAEERARPRWALLVVGFAAAVLIAWLGWWAFRDRDVTAEPAASPSSSPVVPAANAPDLPDSDVRDLQPAENATASAAASASASSSMAPPPTATPMRRLTTPPRPRPAVPRPRSSGWAPPVTER